MKLIGLTGSIGSGKSTVASYLVKKGYVEETFSSPLKKIAVDFGFEENEVYGTQEDKMRINKTWGVSGREFLQKFGTEVCRNTLPEFIPSMEDVWIKLMESKIKSKIKNTVVSDVRFRNEYELIKKHGGVIIHISRDACLQSVSSHASEKEVLPHDYVINNNGTLEELYDAIHQVFSAIEQDCS